MQQFFACADLSRGANGRGNVLGGRGPSFACSVKPARQGVGRSVRSSTNAWASEEFLLGAHLPTTARLNKRARSA